jgi:Zn-finger nucleic acid-binding protein
MNCPHCVVKPRELGGPYRAAAEHARPVELAPERHAAGVDIARCPSCGGVFVAHDDLRTIEDRGFRRGAPDASVVARRAYAKATPAVVCPSCGGEATRRQWGFSSLVMVDVCIECRGVWLDHGELEAIERLPEP